MSNIPLTELPEISPYPVILYQNIYRSKAGNVVCYQQLHESLEAAKKTFNQQSNGDTPMYTLEIRGFAYL